MTPEVRDPLMFALGLVCIAIGACGLRDSIALEQPATSPAQDARNQQLQEAARLQGQVKPDCVWINPRVCVSAAELKRRRQ